MNPHALWFITRRAGVVALALTIAVCGLPAGSARGGQAAADDAAQATAPRIGEVRAGFAGKCKVGYWTAFEIELVGGSQPASGYVELVAPDGDGVPSRVRSPAEGELTLEPGERKIVVLWAKLGQWSCEVTVGFRGQSGLLTSRRLETQAEGPLAGVLPSTATLVVSIGRTIEESPRVLAGANVAKISDLTQLPGQWWAYEGVNAVVLAPDDDERVAQWTADSPQLAALAQWVRMGGTLVLSVGSRAEALLATAAPLERLAPGRLEAMVPLRQGAMLETYVGASESLGEGGRLQITVPKLADVRGRVEAFAGTQARDLPLVVRTPHGFGEVVFVAFDLNRPPFSDWAARARLVDRLLNRSSPDDLQTGGGALGAVTTLGFVDLAGQLRGALDQFAGVELVPFWLVALLVSAYIVCIGPVDYFLVKRVFRRMQLTWLTLAVTVVAFSAGAVALAYGLKARQIEANQLVVVDFDAESGLVRGTGWSSVYSPQSATYDVSLAAEVAADAQATQDAGGAGRLFSWFGLPGGGFGGMDVNRRGFSGLGFTSNNLPQFNEPYEFSGQLDALERVPIAVRSSKAFVGRWWGRGAGRVEANLADEGRLVGTLNNNLDEPLDDAVLIYDKWAYVLRRFEPGARVNLDTDVDPQTVDTFLRRVTAQGDRQVAAPYDRASFDVPRIVRMMTAHDLAGAEKYTALSNQYQGFSELSGLVRSGRAVLIGRVATDAARLELDGRPLDAPGQRWTFYRFVFPVSH